MCSGRVDLEFIFRAFMKRQDGVFIGGCKLGECNYVTHGNFDALANTYIAKRVLFHIGLDPGRLRTDFMSGADGNLLARYTDEFTGQIKALGPLGEAEGLSKDQVTLNLKAAARLVPYLRLAERERFRVQEKTKQSYTEFFENEENNALLDAIITERLAVSQIMLLLDDQPLSTGDIAKQLDLNPSDVSRHMITSSRHGMVTYDMDSKCYTRI